MTEQGMTGGEIMAAVGFIVMLIGFLFGLWKYVDSKISSARLDAQASSSSASALASLAREELAAHRLHVAETYVTKAGMQEQTTQIMRAIEGVGSRIDGMNERLDRAFENPPTRRTMRSS